MLVISLWVFCSIVCPVLFFIRIVHPTPNDSKHTHTQRAQCTFRTEATIESETPINSNTKIAPYAWMKRTEKTRTHARTLRINGIKSKVKAMLALTIGRYADCELNVICLLSVGFSIYGKTQYTFRIILFCVVPSNEIQCYTRRIHALIDISLFLRTIFRRCVSFAIIDLTKCTQARTHKETIRPNKYENV